MNIILLPMLCLTLYESPLGWIAILANEAAIYFVSAPRATRVQALRAARAEAREFVNTPNALGECLVARLREYFREPRRVRFDDLPLDWTRGGEFEQRVWRYLLTIPPGETRTYGEIARTLKCARAARAVGSANGKNPWAIIVPCHRVVGANGDLTGYGGGLNVKEKLLLGEGVALNIPQGRGSRKNSK